VALALLGFAFWIAPRACTGGVELYVKAGVTSLGVLLALPFVVRSGASVRGRVGWALAFAFFGAAVWVIGRFAANVNILCRLF
jgi:hypothetical protein